MGKKVKVEEFRRWVDRAFLGCGETAYPGSELIGVGGEVMMGFDGEVLARVPCELPLGDDVIWVDGKVLKRFLDLLPDDGAVEASSDEEGLKLSYSKKGVSHRITLVRMGREFPSVDVEPEDGYDCPSGLGDMIEFLGSGLSCSSGSRDLSRYVAYSGGMWFGSDGKRANYWEEPVEFLGDTEVWVFPRETLKRVTAIGGWDVWGLSESKEWLVFIDENGSVVGVLVDRGYQYPIGALHRLKCLSGNWTEVQFEKSLTEELDLASKAVSGTAWELGGAEARAEGDRYMYEVVLKSAKKKGEESRLRIPLDRVGVGVLGKELEYEPKLGILRWREGKGLSVVALPKGE